MNLTADRGDIRINHGKYSFSFPVVLIKMDISQAVWQPVVAYRGAHLTRVSGQSKISRNIKARQLVPAQLTVKATDCSANFSLGEGPCHHLHMSGEGLTCMHNQKLVC